MEELKSPICCVLGHVDTGKTKFLDKIRNSNIQDKEVGGITQQMGATFFSRDILSKLTSDLIKSNQIKVPGMLIMDTPGHEMFSNMRDRGSSICQIAIVIVDITHGVEQQTEESIELLKKHNTPFVVALTKLDKIYGWENGEWETVKSLLDRQNVETQGHFWTRVREISLQFNSLGYNVELFHLNKNVKNDISMIPVSNITGDGIPDVFCALIGITQKFMTKKLTFRENTRCVILEVRKLDGVGYTLDVILINGRLKVGDTIMFLTFQGVKTTQIKRIYSPPEGKEIRVKSDLESHDEIKASYSAKLFAEDLSNVIAGTRLYNITNSSEEEIEENRLALESDLDNCLKTNKDVGIHIQTSSMGSMEALLHYCSENKINVASKGLGDISKKDFLNAKKQLTKTKSKKNHIILGFDINVAKDLQKEIDNSDIKLFTNEHIYRLLDEFNKYCEIVKKEEMEKIKEHFKEDLFAPVVLKVIPKYIFNKCNPIVLGVKIQEGTLYKNTQVRIRKGNIITDIGNIEEIRLDNKEVDSAEKGKEVSIKIVIKDNPTNIVYGRNFDKDDLIFSKMTKNTIKALKIFKNEYKIDIPTLNKLIIANNIENNHG
jgi:translation initiation factor aIF-2/yIF-2